MGGRELAAELGLEIREEIELDKLPTNLPRRVPYSFVKSHVLLPIEEHEDLVVAATANPLNLEPLDELRLLFDKEVRAVFVSETVIMEAINTSFHTEEGATTEFLAKLSSDSEGDTENQAVEIYDLLDTKEEAPIIRLLNLIFTEAIQQNASDIHFEPFENDLKVRYRIDGVLGLRHTPPQEYQSQLLTRIKVLAKLDIAEHRLPQDGRIKLSMGGREIDFRVSTVPAIHGERIVLRILDKSNIRLGLDQLGMLPTMLDDFRRLISLTEGIVLVTGPTGSGKTTTLYSALWEIYNASINLMTIEDPVEYKLPGIAQIAVHPKIGLTFATGLRHILRQDPDVVMIGEIRDTETAEIAIQAALTGHLVFSTLHTNDAPSSIPRLIDMGIEPYLLSSTVAGILAQRLVRRVCPECRTSYIPSDEELEQANLDRNTLNGGILYKGEGCVSCFGSGYKGRHGIYELFLVDEQLQSQIAKNVNLSELRSYALQQKMTSLLQHGAHLIRTGVTTVSEVLRVARRSG